MRRVADVDRERLEAVLALLAEYPELTAQRLRELGEAERNGLLRRRTRTQAVRPRTSGEVVALVEAKVIGRAEARRYLRLR
jgi:hypothetical protein